MESNRRPPPPSSAGKQGNDASADLFRTRLKFLYDRRLELARAALRAQLQTLQFQLENAPEPEPPSPSNSTPNGTIHLDPPPSSPPSADAYENVSLAVNMLKQSLAASERKALPVAQNPPDVLLPLATNGYPLQQEHRDAFLSAVRHNDQPLTPSSYSLDLESNPSNLPLQLGIDKSELEDTARGYFLQEFDSLRFSTAPDNPLVYFEPSDREDLLLADDTNDTNANVTNLNLQPPEQPSEEPLKKPLEDDFPEKQQNSVQDTDNQNASSSRSSSSRPPLYVKLDPTSSQPAVTTHALVPSSHNMFYINFGREEEAKVIMKGQDRGHTAYASEEMGRAGVASEGSSSGAKDLTKSETPTSTPTTHVYLQNNTTRRRRSFFERSAGTEPFVVAEPPAGSTDGTVFEIDCTGNIRPIQ